MEVLSQRICKAVVSKEWKPVLISQEGSSLSHIFFADDLLLFGEASFSQACKMEFLLAELCGISGQRVNRDKSRLWFSPDTPCYLQNSICSEFQVSATTNLGSYLGIPLFHGRSTKKFKFLVDEVNRRLAG